MVELIISNYDCATNISLVVFKEDKLVESKKDLKTCVNKFRKLNLWDEEYNMLKINWSDAKFQEYDRVVYCEDGCIFTYIKGVDY